MILGNAYNIASLAGSWGRWDRTRIAHESADAAAERFGEIGI